MTMLPALLSAALASSPLVDVGMGAFLENRAEVPYTGTLIHVRAGMPAGLTLGVSAGSGATIFGPTFVANASAGWRFEPYGYALRPYVATGATYTLVGGFFDSGHISHARAVGGFELMTESRIFGLGVEAGGLKILKDVGDTDPAFGPTRTQWRSWTPVITTTFTWYIR